MKGLAQVSHASAADPVLDDLLADFASRLEAGEAIDDEAYIREHPERADELRRLLPAIAALASLEVGLGSEEAAGGTGREPALGTLGDFRLLREVGRGGMGVVYEAEQLSLHRRVALKVLPFASTLDTKQLQRFKNEAQAAAHLHHQNIVAVHATGCERGVHYYAMQFIEGQTLAEVIASLRPRNADSKGKVRDGQGEADLQQTAEASSAPSERIGGPAADTATQAKLSTLPSTHGRAFYHAVARLGIQAAEALDYSHELGIIHRDIKPANILVDGRGKLWITDFGLAHCQSQAGLTMSGDLVGTLRYMSPEQALAKRVIVDHRTDIYSLGATLYEFLTLEPVFPGADRQELLRQIAFEEPNRLRRHKPAIPVELEIIVLKALEKNPADRYPTAKELAEDLERFTKDEAICARRPSLVRRVRGWCRRHRSLVAATVAIVLTALLLGGAALWRHQLQSASTALAVHDDLDQTARLLREERWADAVKVLERAQARLDGSGPGPLRDEVEKRQRELKLVDQLEKARWQAVAVSWREFQNHVGADRAYRAAFADNGLDVTALSKEEAVGRVKDSAIKSHLVRALDDWAFHRDHLSEGGEPLRAIAQLADNDPWRAKLRDPQIRKDRAALIELAAKGPVLDQPPENLLHLSRLLLDASAPEAALALLLKGQRVYPADFWINYQLTLLLGNDSARAAEAVAFGRAALALRPESPVVYLNLANALGHQGLEKEPEAEALTRKAIALQPDYAVAYIHLGSGLRNQKKFPEAEAAFRKAAELEPTPGILLKLGQFLLFDQHRRSEAEPVYRKAAALAEKELEATKAKFGPDHPETLRSMDDLARCYGNDLVGRANEAVALNEQTLEKRKAQLGLEHRETLLNMENLALAYFAASREDAVTLYAQIVETCKTKLGSDHPETLRRMSNLAFVCFEMGRLREAIQVNEDTLRKRKARLGPDHEDTLLSMNNLAHAYNKAGRLPEAIAMFQEMLPLCKAKLGPDHPAIGTKLVVLGSILLKQQNYNEAEAVLRECLAIRQKYLPDDWATYNAQSLLGDALLGQRRYVDAEPLLLAGYEGIKAREAQTTGERKILAFDALHRLPRLYDAWGKNKEAKRWQASVEAAERNFIRTWLVLSELVPYTGVDGVKALDQEQIAGEGLLRPRAGDPVKVGGKTLTWKEHHTADRHIDFAAIHGPPTDFRLGYAVCYVQADADRTDLVLRAGSDDQAKLYVNGQAVYRQPKAREHELDQDEIPITLHKGVNILVFKVINERLGGPMGSLHFVNKDGSPADGLRMGLERE
jgi:serine/threonine protein kinase/predicted Zn-dependent protease